MLKIFYICLLASLFSCTSISPTPILAPQLIKNNNKVIELYTACSEQGVFNPILSTCNLNELHLETNHVLNLAKEFISADVYQPLGYDVYLSVAMIHFRISEIIQTREFVEAERIARQFFELQKNKTTAVSSKSKFYLIWFTSEHASYQYLYRREYLTNERKQELVFVLGVKQELVGVFTDSVEGISVEELQRLRTAADVLQTIIQSID